MSIRWVADEPGWAADEPSRTEAVDVMRGSGEHFAAQEAHRPGPSGRLVPVHVIVKRSEKYGLGVRSVSEGSRCVRLSGRRASRRSSISYGAFVWPRRALNSQTRPFLVWAVVAAAQSERLVR